MISVKKQELIDVFSEESSSDGSSSPEPEQEAVTQEAKGSVEKKKWKTTTSQEMIDHLAEDDPQFRTGTSSESVQYDEDAGYFGADDNAHSPSGSQPSTVLSRMSKLPASPSKITQNFGTSILTSQNVKLPPNSPQRRRRSKTRVVKIRKQLRGERGKYKMRKKSMPWARTRIRVTPTLLPVLQHPLS